MDQQVTKGVKLSMAKQAREVEGYLLGALERLLKKKSFNDISITELAKVAGVSRMTFYRHYQNITDILTSEMEAVMVELNAKIDFKTMIKHDGLVFIMQFLRMHAAFIRLLVRAQDQDILRTHIAQILVQLSAHKQHLQDFNEREVNYFVLYHSTGLTSVIIDWIVKDQPDTPEELATFLERVGKESNQWSEN